jgi:hypothetical protein
VTPNPWRVIIWTDENNKEVSRMIFHVDETKEVLALPFPKGAVVREPIYEHTFAGPVLPKFFRKCLVNVGDSFTEFINQGDRDCLVLAVDPDTGRYLYEYVMPAGTTALRWEQWDKGVLKHGQTPYAQLSRKWLQLIKDHSMWSEFIRNPQNGKYAMKQRYEELGFHD